MTEVELDPTMKTESDTHNKSFNDRLYDEYLNEQSFRTVLHAGTEIET